MSSSSIWGILWRVCFFTGIFSLILALVVAVLHLGPGVVMLYEAMGCCLLGLSPVFGITDYGWRAFVGDFSESVSIAFAQIMANKLRSALTALGVIIGIVAVTLMGTAILGINAGVDQSLAGLGDDVLYVGKWPWREVDDWWNYRNRRDISTDYAQPINDWIAAHPDSPLKLAVPAADRYATVIRGEYRVDGIDVVGTSADLARIARSEMKEGRFFTEIEARGGRNVAVIGFDVADALFPGESAIGQNFRIRSQQYTVVGVATRQGGWLGNFAWDSKVIVPLGAFARIFPIRWADPEVRVQVDIARMDEAKDELRGVMRRVRGLGPEKKDDFELNSQQLIHDMLDPITRGIAVAGLFITGLALFVGAIGIMNITYVSVKERTKEIGTRKALGARRRTILLQFLIEAVSICVLGGVGGLSTAWGMASLLGHLMPAFPLVFSLWLVFIGLGASMAVGIFSGFAPAWQASKLDPVVALRYE